MEDFRLILSPILKNYSFSCTRCGNCCRKRNIWIGPQQAKRIVNQLGFTLKEADCKIFHKCSGETTELGTILSTQARKLRLIDDICPFLDQRDIDHTFCQIYSIRPSICRCFPFSYSILVANRLVLVLPAMNSMSTLHCEGFHAFKANKNNESAFVSASRLVGEIIEDLRVGLGITDLRDRLSENTDFKTHS